MLLNRLSLCQAYAAWDRGCRGWLLLDRGAARFIISGFSGREIFVDLNRALAAYALSHAFAELDL